MTKLAKSFACGVGHDPSQSTSLHKQCYNSHKNSNTDTVALRAIQNWQQQKIGWLQYSIFPYLDRAATSLPSPASLWLESRIPWLACKRFRFHRAGKACKNSKKQDIVEANIKEEETCMTSCCGIFSITLARHLQGSVSPVWDISTYLEQEIDPLHFPFRFVNGFLHSVQGFKCCRGTPWPEGW